MAEWGIRTWDASGYDNNTGLVRVLVKGYFSVSSGQQSGSYSVSLPSGYSLDYLFQPSSGTLTSSRRRVSISGGTLTISPVPDSDFSAGTQPALGGNFLVYVRK
ncbi:hypothetical protein ACMGGR_11255 [Erwinia sp. BNK-24-b]|uniref:hypothetical protein n=1 Tax=unclassified Erwinia TaxID=2622719 RepID=UPI0039BF4F9A